MAKKYVYVDVGTPRYKIPTLLSALARKGPIYRRISGEVVGYNDEVITIAWEDGTISTEDKRDYELVLGD